MPTHAVCEIEQARGCTAICDATGRWDCTECVLWWIGAIARAVQDRHGGGLIRTFQGIMI
jgi:hypothetical protein